LTLKGVAIRPLNAFFTPKNMRIEAHVILLLGCDFPRKRQYFAMYSPKIDHPIFYVEVMENNPAKFADNYVELT
jgi:hypothetical protein